MTVINTSIINAVIKSFEGEAKAIAKARTIQDKAIQGALDAMFIACDKPKVEFLKGNAKTNAARGQIKGMFDAITEAGYISKSSAASYQSAFWIAFEQGIEFKRDLNNKKDKTEGEASTKGEAKTPTAKSKVLTLEEAQRTFSVTLAQLRAVNQIDLAGELLDVMLDRFPEFKETTVK